MDQGLNLGTDGQGFVAGPKPQPAGPTTQPKCTGAVGRLAPMKRLSQEEGVISPNDWKLNAEGRRDFRQEVPSVHHDSLHE